MGEAIGIQDVKRRLVADGVSRERVNKMEAMNSSP